MCSKVSHQETESGDVLGQKLLKNVRTGGCNILSVNASIGNLGLRMGRVATRGGARTVNTYIFAYFFSLAKLVIWVIFAI